MTVTPEKGSCVSAQLGENSNMALSTCAPPTQAAPTHKNLSILNDKVKVKPVCAFNCSFWETLGDSRFNAHNHAINPLFGFLINKGLSQK